jgi:hypothetical protein
LGELIERDNLLFVAANRNRAQVLKKRTSVNSKIHHTLHKEKEMAAFRKLILGMAAATVFAAVASAQTATPALQCVANAGVPPTVRAEGLTELVGDVTLNCTGGIPTQLGAIVPASNVTVFLNTNVTSRILSTAQGTWSEAILLIDEPHSTSNPNVPLLACGDAGAPEIAGNPGVCLITGTGNGVAVYNGSAGRPNVFQARQGVGAAAATANAVTWSGIPFDAPGSSGTRVVRITNVRANANQLGTSSTLVPTTITMYISVTGSNQLPINNPTQTVAFIQVGLTTSVFNAGSYQQCTSNNPNVASGSSYGAAVADFVVRLREGFQSAFKRKNWATDNPNSGPTPLGTTYPSGGDVNQNVPGAVYNTESAFENIGPNADPSPNPPSQLVNTNAQVAPTAAFPAIHGLNGAGIANSGTRLMLQFSTVVSGTSIWVPTVVRLTSQLSGAVTGTAVLTSTDANGAGGFSPVSSVSGGTITGCSANISGAGGCPAPANTLGLAQVTTFNGAGIAVYEVLYSDSFNPEQLSVPVVVAFVANPGNNLPAPGVQSQVTASFAPLSSVGTASSSDPIPRFAPGAAARNLFIIFKCSCNLLFPFVTNLLGYDTGVAISNTSLDTGTGFGTTPQTGTVTLNYYCGQAGCTSPPQQTTTSAVPAGQQLTFTLSGGGNYGVQATPGFQGYIIAQAQFQYCHAYAFVTAQGSLPTSAGANTGYIALEMDGALPTRTNNLSEVLGH